MSQAQIEALLQRTIGLNAMSLGSQAIARWVRQRMAVCGDTDVAEYLLRLHVDAAELEALIETVIVPETWFFRDREPFVFLGRYVQSEWLANRLNRTLRVLSLPCSTGEEPYSIAIALLEAGLAPHQFRIDAIDISQKSLDKAERGLYDPYSFRGHESVTLQRQASVSPSRLSVRDLYFRPTAAGYQILDCVKALVSFRQGNLLEPEFWVGKPLYDVIFCRNLLIYLDQAARQQTFQVFDRLLRTDGLLFTGHSEISQLPTPQFSALKPTAAFVAQKQRSPATWLEMPPRDPLTQAPRRSTLDPQPPNAQPLITRDRHILPLERNRPFAQSLSPQITPSPAPGSPSISSPLEIARQRANQGQLKSAAKLCETHLTQNPTDADAYVLLGEVQQALGHEHQAEQCFQKALYLHPRHEEALMHLVLIKEQRGDLAGVAIARQRLERLRQLP